MSKNSQLWSKISQSHSIDNAIAQSDITCAFDSEAKIACLLQPPGKEKPPTEHTTTFNATLMTNLLRPSTSACDEVFFLPHPKTPTPPYRHTPTHFYLLGLCVGDLQAVAEGTGQMDDFVLSSSLQQQKTFLWTIVTAALQPVHPNSSSLALGARGQYFSCFLPPIVVCG